MISYAAGQASPRGPHGIASYPWQWLGDYKPIDGRSLPHRIEVRNGNDLYGVLTVKHYELK